MNHPASELAKSRVPTTTIARTSLGIGPFGVIDEGGRVPTPGTLQRTAPEARSMAKILPLIADTSTRFCQRMTNDAPVSESEAIRGIAVFQRMPPVRASTA